jgi:hypothetical protein
LHPQHLHRRGQRAAWPPSESKHRRHAIPATPGQRKGSPAARPQPGGSTDGAGLRL